MDDLRIQAEAYVALLRNKQAILKAELSRAHCLHDALARLVELESLPPAKQTEVVDHEKRKLLGRLMGLGAVGAGTTMLAPKAHASLGKIPLLSGALTSAKTVMDLIADSFNLVNDGVGAVNDVLQGNFTDLMQRSQEEQSGVVTAVATGADKMSAVWENATRQLTEFASKAGIGRCLSDAMFNMTRAVEDSASDRTAEALVAQIVGRLLSGHRADDDLSRLAISDDERYLAQSPEYLSVDFSSLQIADDRSYRIAQIHIATIAGGAGFAPLINDSSPAAQRFNAALATMSARESLALSVYQDSLSRSFGSSDAYRHGLSMLQSVEGNSRDAGMRLDINVAELEAAQEVEALAREELATAEARLRAWQATNPRRTGDNREDMMRLYAAVHEAQATLSDSQLDTLNAESAVDRSEVYHERISYVAGALKEEFNRLSFRVDGQPTLSLNGLDEMAHLRWTHPAFHEAIRSSGPEDAPIYRDLIEMRSWIVSLKNRQEKLYRAGQEIKSAWLLEKMDSNQLREQAMADARSPATLNEGR